MNVQRTLLFHEPGLRDRPIAGLTIRPVPMDGRVPF